MISRLTGGRDHATIVPIFDGYLSIFCSERIAASVRLSRVGVLGQVSSRVGLAELDEASGKLNVALEVADIRTPDDLNGAFDAMVAKQVGALLIVIGPLTYLLRQPIAELALKHGQQLPTRASSRMQVC